jgi:short-subunit dehydrogenase
MEKTFKNKVVLITGASSGTGKALAYEFANNGAHVILLARRFQLISSIAEDLALKFNKCMAIECNVAKDGDIEKAVKESVKIFGKIDIVIANAGFGLHGNFEDLKLEDYKKQFETNVFGVLRTIYATLPELKKTKGSICIIGSVNSIVSFSSGISPYVMSKFALRGLIKSLSLELSPYNISVTHIMPGFIETEFDIKNTETERKKYNWLKISAEKAAKLIIRAIKDKNLEVILTRHGKMAIYLERYTPYILRKLSSLFSKIK